MNFKRIGRCLVCLLLVCALMVNISPVKAKATAGILPALVKVAVEAAPVVPAAVMGLGIAKNVSDTDWNQLCDNVYDSWKASGVIDENGGMNLYQASDGVYGIEAGLLQDTFDSIWDNDVLSMGLPSFVDSSFFYENTIFGPSEFVGDAPFLVYAFDWVQNGDVNGAVIIVSDVYQDVVFSHTVTEEVGLSRQIGDLYYAYRSCYLKSASDGDIPFLGTWDSSEYNQLYYCSDALVRMLNSSISTALDLELYDVADAGSTIADGYPDWSANAIEGYYDETTGMMVYPIGTVGTVADISTYTQSDIQSGTVPYIQLIIKDDVGAGTGTADPNPDVTPDTNALTQAGFDASLAAFLAELGALLIEWFEKQFGVISSICAFVESIYGTVERISQFVADIFNILFTVFDPILEWLEKLVTGQTTIIDSIIALPGVIGDVITGVLTDVLTLVFVPSEGFVVLKVEALTANFPWVDPILASGVNLKAFLSGLGATPPVIYIDLGATEGSYNLGGKQVFMDLSWYSAYKGTMDTVSSAFIYLWLGWRVFMTLPGLINGSSGLIGPIADRVEVHTQIKSGPPRKKE